MATRPPFTDTPRLKRAAKAATDDGTAHLRSWWVKKYELPPTHLLFLNQSHAALVQEMYEDLYRQLDEVTSELENDENPPRAEQRDVLMRQLQVLNKALDEEQDDGDDLVDEWEAALERGEMPDLDAMPGA